MKDVPRTNGIPKCPNCKKPTNRVSGSSLSTCMYFPPVYNEKGVNTNPDRNINTEHYTCLECNTEYAVEGNYVDGFEYAESPQYRPVSQ